ncbi:MULTISPECIES: hypothetical protein [Flavobacterium]|uniref:Uncharacterized protein n=1 Tax=Flavobacterium jumunjinense TaxID=998845 RepID=A0ABV5GN00_9FLAO|nr:MULTISPECIES: hypothetical protein [Flavobacterium]
MYKKISILFLFAFVCSCSKGKQKEINVANETPQVLQNNDSDISLRSFGKKYDFNIIDKLYNEAIEKDESLKKLENVFLYIGGVKKDSLKDFNDYLGNNARYWNDVDDYLKQIKDTILRKEVTKDFDKFEKEFKKSITSLQHKDSLLNMKSVLLDDYHTIMKLKITHNMMMKYNTNEFPKDKNHVFMDKKYDTLMVNIKEQIKKYN